MKFNKNKRHSYFFTKLDKLLPLITKENNKDNRFTSDIPMFTCFSIIVSMFLPAQSRKLDTTGVDNCITVRSSVIIKLCCTFQENTLIYLICSTLFDQFYISKHLTVTSAQAFE
jgi:hypothetical protein